MIHEEKKVAKIVEELTMFFFAIGADDIQSGIQLQKQQATISFRANFHPDYRHKLNKLEQYLKEQKNDGVEDIYWELAGSGDPGETSQLLLVGMMVDHAQIQWQENDYVLLKLKKVMLDA